MHYEYLNKDAFDCVDLEHKIAEDFKSKLWSTILSLN